MMKQLSLFLTVLLFLLSPQIHAQDLIERISEGEEVQHNLPANRIADMINESRNYGHFEETKLLRLNSNMDRNQYNEVIDGAVFLDLDRDALQEIRINKNQNIQLSIPITVDKNVELELTQVQIKTDLFRVKTSDGRSFYDFDNSEKSIFYRGIVKGDVHSMAVMTVFNNSVRILIADNGGNYILGKLGNSTSYILYNENKAKVDLKLPGMCETEDLPTSHTQGTNNGLGAVDPGDCVKVYVEADFKIYQEQGSTVQGVQDYVDAIFNELIAEFALAGVEIYVSELFVWTSSDPYVSLSSTSDILSTFRDNRPTFNGNLAHFITSRSFGGRAYRPGLCGSSPYGMSGGLTTGNPANLPLSSSTFIRIAHELGHNLNLSHSHACVWNGNNTQIDDCGNVWAVNAGETPEGNSCFDVNNPILPASGGGTIMSYCHVDGTGRNLANGFTSQGDAVMQAWIASGTCMDPFCEPQTDPNDAGITQIIAPDGTLCNNAVVPVIVLYNFGSNLLTSVDINYSTDGTSFITYPWTGAMVNGGSTTINLPPIFVGDGSYTFSVFTSNPNGSTDSDPSNDANSSTFSVISSGQAMELNLATDNYGGETSWEVRDFNNTIVFSGSGYAGNTPSIVENFCLQDGCYTFTIYDSFGDGICCAYGEGAYTLRNTDENNMYVTGGEFTSAESTSFCIQSGGCEMDINLPHIVGQDTYNAFNSITSDGVIQSGRTHVFQAGNFIQLLPGFDIELSADFTGEIAPCSPNMPTTTTSPE